jgi:hypothetical protein
MAHVISIGGSPFSASVSVSIESGEPLIPVPKFETKLETVARSLFGALLNLSLRALLSYPTS